MKPDNGLLDLERLTSADAPELHRALDAVKQQLPDAQQLAALAASLSQIGIPVARSAHAAATPASAASRLKLLLGAGVIGPLTVALLLWRAPAPRAAAPSAVSSTTTPALSTPSGEGPRGLAASSNGAKLQASQAALPPEPSSVPPPSSETIDTPQGDSAPRAALSAVPLAPLAPAAGARKATPEVLRTPTTTDRASPENSGSGVAARPTELALLRDARLALASNPAQALALTEQHRVEFARGAMIQERELIAISALARMGRHTAVLARAAQFERDFPSSPYRKQVSALAQ